MALTRVLDFNSDHDDEFNQFELELDCGDQFSPNRTRSGRVHGGRSHVGLKRRRNKNVGRAEHSTTRNAADGDLADNEENDDDNDEKLPPVPIPSARLFSLTREKRYQHDLPSSPARPSSPPFQSQPSSPRLGYSPIARSASSNCSLDDLGLLSPTKACRLSSFSVRHLSSTVAGRGSLTRSRLRFDADGDLMPNSCPPLPSHLSSSQSKSSPARAAANVNPFTQRAMHEASLKKLQSSNNQSFSSSWAMSQSEYSSQDASMSVSDESEQDTSLPAKRLRVSDISITRYQEEFLELNKVASGQFGVVVKARHRLDGIVYAIKITKKYLRANSLDEKMAMNEVFAHAALMKNKHVVRYFNSWVEKGQIYIQNEFCDGGSLEQKLADARRDDKVFSEEELHRLLLHLGKGLKYIHSRQLVHLDIKPGNIFLALDPDMEPLPNLLTDSGAGSGDALLPPQPQIRYKIGDLGHMAPIQGSVSPTEGDCRYMAPEFLQMDLDTNYLTKADMYSTGITLYEAASLVMLPRNSEDNSIYKELKLGLLPPLPNYSKKLHSLLRSLVYKNPARRISASKLITNTLINPLASKSKVQLWRELQNTKKRLAELENKVSE